MSDACDCCSQPPCSTPQLEYISSAGSCVLDCAYFNNEDGKYYLNKVETSTTGLVTSWAARRLGPGETIPALIQPADPEDPESEDVELAPEMVEGDCVFEKTCSGSSTQTDTMTSTPWGDPPPDCSEYSANTTLSVTSTWTGSGTYDSDGFLRQGDGCSVVYSGSGSSSVTTDEGTYSNSATVAADGTVTWDGGYGSFSCCTGAAYSTQPAAYAILHYCDCFTSYYYCIHESWETTYAPPIGEGSTVYSNEISDCEITLPAYPAWPNEPATPPLAGQGTGNSAYYQLSAGVVSKRKFKYRVKHEPPGTCYLKVWIKKTTTPIYPLSGPPVTDVTTYEWVGSGNPCLPDPNAVYYDDDNRVYSTPVEILVPATYSLITVSIEKYSCVQGYEPDISDSENPQPNGYPDPDWEAAPP